MTAASLSIRDATPADIPAITAIYAYAVLHTVATMDTDKPTLSSQTEWFNHHGARHPVLVAERAGEVVGWASLSEWSTRKGYSDTVEASVYVSPECHGSGIGTRLLKALIESSRVIGLHSLIARISATNEVSLRLARNCGFTDVGTMHESGMKFGGYVDVVVLELLLHPPGD